MRSFIEIRNTMKESDTDARSKTWKKWNELVNMTLKEIQDYYDSDEGKDSGMKKKDASDLGINTGRESAAMLIKMIPIGKSFVAAEEKWTDSMWTWANKQISFISRMKGMKSRMTGNPFVRDGKRTRWYKSLLIWGHDPKK